MGLEKPKSPILSFRARSGAHHSRLLPVPCNLPRDPPTPACPPPSVLIFKDVRTRAKSVALNVTVPSELRGMFIATSLCIYQGNETHFGQMPEMQA